jgi:dihydrofolate reductase
MKTSLYIIVATDINNGIGKSGKMPWDFKKEMNHFKTITTKTTDKNKQNMVIMGRTTWESIPQKFRPLKGRKNMVLTGNKDYMAKGAKVCNSIDTAINFADENIENIFIMGGASVYKEAINHPNLSGIYITKINKTYDCDTFFPQIPKNFSKLKTLGKEKEGKVNFDYLLYEID